MTPKAPQKKKKKRRRNRKGPNDDDESWKEAIKTAKLEQSSSVRAQASLQRQVAVKLATSAGSSTHHELRHAVQISAGTVSCTRKAMTAWRILRPARLAEGPAGVTRRSLGGSGKERERATHARGEHRRLTSFAFADLGAPQKFGFALSFDLALLVMKTETKMETKRATLMRKKARERKKRGNNAEMRDSVSEPNRNSFGACTIVHNRKVRHATTQERPGETTRWRRVAMMNFSSHWTPC